MIAAESVKLRVNVLAFAFFQATSSEDGDSVDEEKGGKRRISFTADLSQGKEKLFPHAGATFGFCSIC